MKKPRLAALAALLPTLVLVTGCAETAKWNGGDACTEIGHIQVKLQDNEEEQNRLQGKTTRTDEESESLVRQLERLEEERRDLKRKSADLMGRCDPRDTETLDGRRRLENP